MDSTELVIQGATAAVAVAAVGAAVWEGTATRLHNRLSVMPNLCLQRHLAGSRGRFGLSVFNAGLGPALISGCLTLVDGAPADDIGDNGWNAAISTLGLQELRMAFETIGPPAALTAGERVWLLSIPANAENQRHIPAIKQALDRLRVTISYESMYGDKRVAES